MESEQAQPEPVSALPGRGAVAVQQRSLMRSGLALRSVKARACRAALALVWVPVAAGVYSWVGERWLAPGHLSVGERWLVPGQLSVGVHWLVPGHSSVGAHWLVVERLWLAGRWLDPD